MTTNNLNFKEFKTIAEAVEYFLTLQNVGKKASITISPHSKYIVTYKD